MDATHRASVKTVDEDLALEEAVDHPRQANVQALHAPAKGFLISEERLFLRSGARCAHKGLFFNPKSDEISVWLRERIDDSIGDVLREDEFRMLKDAPIERPEDNALLMDHLGFNPKIARAAQVTFNSQESAVRRAYFTISIMGTHPEQYARDGGGTLDEIHAHMRDSCPYARFMPICSSRSR